LIIAILFEEFVQSGPVRARGLQVQLKAERGKQFGDFCEAQLSGTSVFERIESGTADSSFAGKRGLAKPKPPAALGDLAAIEIRSSTWLVY